MSAYVEQARTFLRGQLSFEELRLAALEYRMMGELSAHYPAFIAFNAVQAARGPRAGSGLNLRQGLVSGVEPLAVDEDWTAVLARARTFLGD